jgi:hypothetical protein
VDLHPDLEPVRFLVGSWRGAGRGEYPTIEPFRYTEEVSYVSGPAKPFLAYTQRTRGEDGSPLHSEVGYLRMTPAGPELVIAQPTGLIEVHRGVLTGTGLEFRSLTVEASPTAKAVGTVVRRLSATEDDALSYTLDMAYADVPLTLHLEARLERVPG